MRFPLGIPSKTIVNGVIRVLAPTGGGVLEVMEVEAGIGPLERVFRTKNAQFYD